MVARLPLPRVYTALGLIPPILAVWGDEIAHAGAAALDRAFEDFANGDSQLLALPAPHAKGPASGPDSGLVQGLICVNVADPGDDGLIEEQLFHGHPATPEGLE